MPSPDPKNIEPRSEGRAARLAALVASGRTLKSAAEELGINYKVAKAWHRNPRFKERIQRLQDEACERTTRALVASSTAAVAELVRLMARSGDENIKLRAAVAILDRMPRPPAATAQALAVAIDPGTADAMLRAAIASSGGGDHVDVGPED